MLAILILFVLFWPFESSTHAASSIDGVVKQSDVRPKIKPTVFIEPTAALVKRSLYLRVLDVTTAHGTFTVEYNGYGICYESVLVDGKLAARRSGLFGKMSHRYEFAIGPSKAALTVSLSAWGEVIPLSKLQSFSLELDGRCVYAESGS